MGLADANHGGILLLFNLVSHCVLGVCPLPPQLLHCFPTSLIRVLCVCIAVDISHKITTTIAHTHSERRRRAFCCVVSLLLRFLTHIHYNQHDQTRVLVFDADTASSPTPHHKLRPKNASLPKAFCKLCRLPDKWTHHNFTQHTAIVPALYYWGRRPTENRLSNVT